MNIDVPTTKCVPFIVARISKYNSYDLDSFAHHRKISIPQCVSLEIFLKIKCNVLTTKISCRRIKLLIENLFKQKMISKVCLT